MSRVEFEVVTPKGAVIRTFDDRKLAVDWLTKLNPAGVCNLDTFPGARIQRVEYPEPVRTTVWRERGNLKLVGAA